MPDTTETTPRSEMVKVTKTDDYLLTHSIWHNGYGPCPETGVRPIIDGKAQDNFHLIQHGVRDFDFAEQVILRGLRKNWDTVRIADFLEKLSYRRRPRAVFL